MLTALCAGTLVRDPQERTSAAGKPYVTALVRVPCEDGEPMLVSCIAFDAGAVQAILALGKGDAVCIAGRAKPSRWERDGEQKHGLSVVADQVLTAYQVEKRRRISRAAEEEPANAH